MMNPNATLPTDESSHRMLGSVPGVTIVAKQVKNATQITIIYQLTSDVGLTVFRIISPTRAIVGDAQGAMYTCD
jgi:hypothetical protein